MSRSCTAHVPSTRATAAGAVSGFSAIVQLSKAEAIDACGRLAIAQRSLARRGELAAAEELAVVFDLLQQRVALVGPSARPRA